MICCITSSAVAWLARLIVGNQFDGSICFNLDAYAVGLHGKVTPAGLGGETSEQ